MQRLLISLAAALFLAACATKPQPTESAAPQAQPQAQPEVRPAAEPVPPAPVVPGPAAKEQSRKMALRAADLLEDGKVDEAKTELDHALALDAGNKIAASLSRQLTADPVATLGKESFSYTVRPGDTLSRIAEKNLGDLYQFYILARYNNIQVPRNLHAGQVIRVPGKAPPPEPRAEPAKPTKPPPEKPPAVPPVASPPPKPDVPPISPGERAYQSGLQALKTGDKEKAYSAFNQAIKADPDHQDARAKAEQVREDLIQRYHRNATAAFHRQDLDNAIKQWDKVLELDPNHASANLQRQRALDLKAKLQAK